MIITNDSLKIFLISDDVKGVMVNYDPDAAKQTSYFFKTFDTSLQVDDYVAIPTDSRHKMTVGRVTEINVEPDFADNQHKFKWIVGKVNKDNYDRVIADETNALEKIQSAERRKMRAELRANLIADDEAIKALPMYTVEDDKTE